jgi:hypothetical protein
MPLSLQTVALPPRRWLERGGGDTMTLRSARLWAVLRVDIPLRRKRAISEVANDAGEADNQPNCHAYDYCVHPFCPLVRN